MFEYSVRAHEDSDTIVIAVGPQLECKDFVLKLTLVVELWSSCGLL